MSAERKPVIIAKITSKNQITIPKQVREILDVHSHDEIAFVLNDTGEITVRKEEPYNEFWCTVAEQLEKYDISGEPEFDWGEDVGSEVID